MGKCVSKSLEIAEDIIELNDETVIENSNNAKIEATIDIPEIENINKKKLENYLFRPLIGRVIKVYDGDTFTIATYSDNDKSILCKCSCRINGIDTPELHPKNYPSESDMTELQKKQKESEIKLANEAKEFLSEMILGKIVNITNHTKEKYGRVLADFIVNINGKDIDLKYLMIDKRFALPYDGGTKIIPTDWIEYHQTGVV